MAIIPILNTTYDMIRDEIRNKKVDIWRGTGQLSRTFMSNLKTTDRVELARKLIVSRRKIVNG
jgi:hypothetical protein